MKKLTFYLRTDYAKQLDTKIETEMSRPVQALYAAFKAQKTTYEVTDNESLNTCYLSTVAFDTEIIRVPCLEITLNVPQESPASCPEHLDAESYRVGVYLAAEAVKELPF